MPPSGPLPPSLAEALAHSYDIERELGGGGMSRVFLARDRALGRDVVIKTVAIDTGLDLSTQRFAREIELAARLQQANIVPVLGAGMAGDVPYYVMPYVEGESLRAVLAARGRIPLGEAIDVLRGIAKALA